MGLGDTVAAAVNAATEEGTIDSGGDEETSLLDDAGGDDESADESGDESDAGGAEDEGADGEKPKAESKPKSEDKSEETDPDAKWLEEFGTRHGLKKKADGRWNPVPHHRWQKMVASETKQERAAIGKVLGLPETTDFGDGTVFSKAVTEAIKDLPTLRKRGEAFDQLIEIMKNPADYIQVLANDEDFGEAWKPYVKHFIQSQGGDTTEKPKAESAAADFNEPEPKPDHTDANGNRGWTEKGWAEHQAWSERRMTHNIMKAVQAVLDQKLESEIKPLKQEHDTAALTRKQLKEREQTLTEVLEEASLFPNWTNVEEEVRKVINEDPEIKKIDDPNLARRLRKRIAYAYHKVQFGKLTTERKKIREEVDKEVEAGSKPDGLKPGPVVKSTPKPNGQPGSIVAAAVAKAEAEGRLKG